MKSTKIKLCSAVLSATTLMSMLTFLPTNAAEIKTEIPESFTSMKTVEDERGIHFYGPTGNNLTADYETPDDVTVIESLDEYNKISGNTQKIGINNKPMKKEAELPEFVDNSESIYFPEIGDQQDLGSCLFWAQVYYQYTYEFNRAMNIPTTYETTFSPQWSYNVATAGDDMQCYTPISLNFMIRQGSVPMTQVPYDSQYLNAHPTEEIWRNSINYRLKDIQMFDQIGTKDTQITSPDDSDLLLIKNALNNGEILSYSTMMYGWTHVLLKTNSDAPENDKHLGEIAVTSMDSQEGGHRMTLVGYNDNLWIDINNNDKVDKGEMGAFKIANSWGLEYGNEGYCWVAYDALNLVSCVDGVAPNQDRDYIFTEVTRFELSPYGANTDVYLKYTLNTADRTQVQVKITAEKDGTVYKISPESNMVYGVPVAYDGSTKSTDATLICPLQGDIPDLTADNAEDYTWTVEFVDMKQDGVALTVKDTKIVNEKTGVNIEVNNTFPLTIDGETKNIKFHESGLNHAVVYYRGYYTPSISYKINDADSQWQNDVVIEENYERYGYTHKYVIDLEASDKATLYFTDKDGKIDDNNGKYFTATRGLNYYITENMGKPIKITMTNDIGDVADVGRFGLFKTESTGGYEPYMYEYIITNLTTGEETVDDYWSTPDKGVYFTEEGYYKITANLKDCAGTIVSAENYVTIKNIPFEFTTFETTSQNNTLVNNHPITFTAVTNFENIGLRYEVYHDYNLTIKRGNEVYYNTTLPMIYDQTNPEYMTSTIIAKWTPIQSGTYTATISATDCAGEYAEKTIEFSVNDCTIGDADGDGDIDVADVTFLQMYLSRLSDKDCLRIDTADTDRDTEININDATHIQLYIAGFTDIEFVGYILYDNLPQTTQPVTEPKTEPTTEQPTEPVRNKITFTNSLNWSGIIYCYYWSEDHTTMISWPGEPMIYESPNVYTFVVPEEATYVLFTNGSVQTVEIPYNSFYSNFYPLTTTDGQGHHQVLKW